MPSGRASHLVIRGFCYVPSSCMANLEAASALPHGWALAMRSLQTEVMGTAGHLPVACVGLTETSGQSAGQAGVPCQ